MDQALIEQIVANVLQELQPTPALRAETVATVVAEVQLDVPVITAGILQDRVQAGQTVRIGKKSLITPTARDWLHTHQVRWQRGGHSNASTGTPQHRRQLLISTITPAVRTLSDAASRELPGWKHELSGNSPEVANAAIRAINAAEAELVVVISDAADVVACRANRNERVRAAVVVSPEHLRLLAEHMGPNVLVINPRNRSFVELRNLMHACAALPAPRPPRDWE
jgi:hypothetical protein